MRHRQVLRLPEPASEIRERIRASLPDPLRAAVMRTGLGSQRAVTGLIFGPKVWVRPIASAHFPSDGELVEPKLRGRVRQLPDGSSEFEYRVFPGTSVPHPGRVVGLGVALLLAAIVFGMAVHSLALGAIAAAPGYLVTAFIIRWFAFGRRAVVETTAVLDSWIEDLRSNSEAS